jgi:phospholipid/cholesterol/gamma-HCH transport system permease protein
MSETLLTDSPPVTGAVRGGWPRRALASIGREMRRRTKFMLLLASLAWGVVRAAPWPNTWRRTVRFEFRRALRQAIAGGLSTVLITAALIGVLMVYQALYWLGAAGQEGLIGSILVTVLVREIAPVLTGLIVLGRSGMVVLSEVGRLGRGGQLQVLEAQGLDTFQLLVLPRACAFAIASFTQGIMFILAALVTGFVAGSLLGAVHISIWSFFDRVLLALHARDFIIVPAKLIVIGLLIALTVGLTALTAGPKEDIANLLPRGFARGVLMILIASLAFSFLA